MSYFQGQGQGQGQELVLPKSSLGYATNTNYPKFPPLMMDGRSIVSNWQSETIANDNLIKKNQITSNWMYRKYLQQNAKEIMKQNFVETANDTGYMTVPKDKDDNRGTPTLYSSIYTEPQNRDTSDLKSLYMSREQLNAKKNVISIPSYDGPAGETI
jgi:hypothetical protein